MICNPDGTPYELNHQLITFDPTNPIHELINEWDNEMINISGSPILYYEVFIQSNTVDPLYIEDRGKMWSPIPCQLMAWYVPLASQNAQSEFGIDALEEIEFQLNYQSVLQTLGHPPKVGSRIYSPHRCQNWIIIQRDAADFILWGTVRLKLHCSVFQEDLATGIGRMTESTPTYKIN